MRRLFLLLKENSRFGVERYKAHKAVTDVRVGVHVIPCKRFCAGPIVARIHAGKPLARRFALSNQRLMDYLKIVGVQSLLFQIIVDHWLAPPFSNQYSIGERMSERTETIVCGLLVLVVSAVLIVGLAVGLQHGMVTYPV